MSKKMPGFDSYSAAYMGFNDYNPDYQYETSYSDNKIKMEKMSYDYHPMSYAKSVDYQHYEEPKPTYYEDRSYAKPRPMKKKYVDYQKKREPVPHYYEDKSYAKPRPM